MESVIMIPEIFTISKNLYFVLMNAEGFYIAANPAFLRKSGLDEDSLSAIHSFEIIHPDDHDACRKMIHFCLSHAGEPGTIDLRIYSGTGHFLPTRWEFTCLQNETASYIIQCIGYAIAEHTVTDKPAVSANNEISSKEELHRQLLSNSIDVFLLTNEQCEISYCSPNIKKILEYEPAELIGTNGFSYVHPDDLACALEIFADELSNPGSNHSVDMRFRKKGGGWVWVEAKGSNLLHNPEVKAILINLNDISLRKQSETALAESELRYKSFFNHLTIPLFIISNDHLRILDVNDSAVEKYGYSKKEFSEISFYNLFKEPVTAGDIEEIYTSGRAVPHKTKAGKNILVTIDKQKIQFSDANGFVLLVTDVTESNYIQQENELGFEVSEILIQPKSLSTNLQAALKLIRTFTGWDIAEMCVPNYEGLLIKKEAVDFEMSIYNKQIHEFLELKNEFDTPSTGNDYALLASMKPVWIEKLSESEFDFKRKEIAGKCGFQSCLIVPVVNDRKITCVFSFFSFEQRPVNRSETNLISVLGKLFGAEIEKRKNSLMLDTFFQISNDILTISGLDGRYKRVNPAFEQFSGYNKEEAKEIHPLSYVYNDDKPMVLEKLEGLSKGIAVPYFENRVVTKEGLIKWIAWTSTPILTEGIVIASHRDITAQKQVAEELRIINERYGLVTKATNEAIWDLDLINNEMTWSEGYKILFGHDFGDVASELDFWEANIHPDERERVVKGFNDFLQQHNTPYWNSEYRFRKSDGTYAHVLDKGYLIFDKENTPLRMVGAMQDITERKKLEHELLIKERNKQNQIAQAVVFAQEKERAEIGKELHDNVGQQLTTTKLYLEMLKHKLDDPLELIERVTKHINTVIHTIRNLSHSLVPASIKDLGLIDSVHDLIENIQALGKLDIYFVAAPDLENRMNESIKLTLYRIIQESLNNVVRHANASHVTIELFEEDHFIRLVITDNGRGFNIITVKKGQGLKNIASRIELQDGSLDVITNPGRGCKLSIQIPIIL